MSESVMTPETLTLRELLAVRRDEFQVLLGRYGATSPKLFGSVARGTASAGSGIGILVEMDPAEGTLLMRASGLIEETRALFGRDEMDVFPTQLLKRLVSASALAEAAPTMIINDRNGQRHMAEATEIPSCRPGSEWYEDWPFDVDTSAQVEARVTGSAADRAVEAILEPLTHDPGADGDGWRIVLASAGEDGFDSLESAASDLVDALRATPGEVRPVWHELPATRVTDTDPDGG